MDQNTKDIIDAVSKLGGLGTVIAGFIGVILQLQKARQDRSAVATQQAVQADKDRLQREDDARQRDEELQWRRARLARDVLTDLLRRPPVSDALRLLDWDNRTYEVAGASVRITHDEARPALRISNLDFTEREMFVRDVFDALFSSIQDVEHYLATNMIDFAAVEHPFGYYVSILARDKAIYAPFLEEYGYAKALRFLARFPAWQTDRLDVPTGGSAISDGPTVDAAIGGTSNTCMGCGRALPNDPDDPLQRGQLAAFDDSVNPSKS